jgi:tellurite resistance-related uncharacterized protein
MKRVIVDFFRDGAPDWVAQLDCGHLQHVGHSPPVVLRPWVETEQRRREKLGETLECPSCERFEVPEAHRAYSRTPEFDQSTMPRGLKSDHHTKRGVWATIRVLEGRLRYTVGDPVNREFLLEPGKDGIVLPQVPHQVEPVGSVRFYVEFMRAENPSP